MADRPIIFSAPMVRALLAGRKTQTRRLLKPQPPEWATFCQQILMFNIQHQWVPSGLWQWCEPETTPPRSLRRWPIDAQGDHHYGMRLRYQPGDRLWVREGWAPVWVIPQRAIYRADGERQPGACCGCAWKPSIHMPRWASRLTLVVTEVRLERLQDIRREDAIAEGIQRVGGGFLRWENWSGAEGQSAFTPEAAYAVLWNSLHGPDAWAANPWVVALTFSVAQRNIDAEAGNHDRD